MCVADSVGGQCLIWSGDVFRWTTVTAAQHDLYVYRHPVYSLFRTLSIYLRLHTLLADHAYITGQVI